MYGTIRLVYASRFSLLYPVLAYMLPAANKLKRYMKLRLSQKDDLAYITINKYHKIFVSKAALRLLGLKKLNWEMLARIKSNGELLGNIISTKDSKAIAVNLNNKTLILLV